MHRSGTSALAGALDRLGIDFGKEEELFPAALDNPRGFFERAPIVQLNDDLLAEQGLSWDLVDPDPREQDSLCRKYLPRARDLISLPSGHVAGGLKDPRICITLPFWRRVLLDRCVAVRIRRDPAEVIWSLKLRDGFSPMVGAALLMAYDRHLENGLDGLRVIDVSYEDLVDDPFSTLKRVAHELSELIEFGEGWEGRLKDAASSIEPSLRVTTIPSEITESYFVREARQSRLRFSQNNNGESQRVNSINSPSLWEREVLIWRKSDRDVKRHHDLIVSGLCTERQSLEQQRVELLGRIGSLEDDLFALEDRYQTQVKLIENRCAEMTERVAEMATSRDSLRESLEKSERQVLEGEELLLNQRDQLASLTNNLVSVQEELRKVYGSRTWRLGLLLAAPVRLVRRAFHS
jgi:hypothetical protein